MRNSRDVEIFESRRLALLTAVLASDLTVLLLAVDRHRVKARKGWAWAREHGEL